MAQLGSLRELWMSVRTGTLSPLGQMRAVALRDAFEEVGEIPEKGEEIELGKYILKIKKVSATKIEQIILTKSEIV